MSWDQPSSGVCIKLASAVAHHQEALASGGHRFDLLAMESCLKDPEVLEWLKSFPSALLPVKRR